MALKKILEKESDDYGEEGDVLASFPRVVRFVAFGGSSLVVTAAVVGVGDR